MPVVRIGTPGFYETMIRPTTVTIVKQVIASLRLDENIEVRYISHSGDVRLPGSGLAEDDNKYAQFSGTNRIWIEVEEDIDEDGWLTSKPELIDTQPLFEDVKLDVGMYPFMEPSVTTLKIRISSHNRDTLVQTRNFLASKISTLRDGIQHKVDFAIALPNSVHMLLYSVWERREANGGYGDSFRDYLVKHTDRNLTTVSDASGEKQSLVFRRRMGRINGYFKINSLPEKPAYQDDKSIWETTIEYEVKYDVPTQLTVRYPIMVHNQYMPDAFLMHLERPTDIRDFESNRSMSQIASGLTEFGYIEGENELRDMWIRIPEFDYFEPKITTRNTATVLYALLTVEGKENELLLNLKDLGDWYLDSHILELIEKSEYPFLNQLYRSIVQIQLYKDDLPMELDTIYCDNELNIYSRVALDVRSSYRFRLSLCADLVVIPAEVLSRCMEYPDAVLTYLRAINIAIRNNTDYFQDLWHRPHARAWMISYILAARGQASPSSAITQIPLSDLIQALKHVEESAREHTWYYKEIERIVGKDRVKEVIQEGLAPKTYAVGLPKLPEVKTKTFDEKDYKAFEMPKHVKDLLFMQHLSTVQVSSIIASKKG